MAALTSLVVRNDDSWLAWLPETLPAMTQLRRLALSRALTDEDKGWTVQM